MFLLTMNRFCFNRLSKLLRLSNRIIRGGEPLQVCIANRLLYSDISKIFHQGQCLFELLVALSHLRLDSVNYGLKEIDP